jgi:hypothetical protein
MSKRPIEDYEWARNAVHQLRIRMNLQPGESIFALLSGPQESGSSEYDIPNTGTKVEDGDYAVLTFEINKDVTPGPYKLSRVQITRELHVLREEPIDDYLHICVTIKAGPIRDHEERKV